MELGKVWLKKSANLLSEGCVYMHVFNLSIGDLRGSEFADSLIQSAEL